MPLQHALDKAKITLMSNNESVFFTTVLFSLKFMWDKTIRTACTNGSYIKFNPDFFMKLSPEERVFVLLHESQHVAFMHMDRLKDRDPKKWNVAADHVINLMLKSRGFKMPKLGLADPIYTGMCTEEVYKLLPDQTNEDVEIDLEAPDKPSEELQKEVEEILIRASIQAKMQGCNESIPVDIQVFLDSLLKPKLPWNRILQKYIQNMTKCDYSFRTPNRRFFPQYYLPSLKTESLMDIAIAVDISGSVSDEEFKVFISETHSILRMMKPEKITLIQFNTEITEVSSAKSTKELKEIKFHGRGGTRIGPVINWANENKPKLLLVFTDGDFNFYGAKSEVETLWLIHNSPDFKATSGKVIHYKV